MSTVSQIRTALAATLATIDGLTAHATVPGQINPPCAVIRRRSGPQEDTLRGQTVSYVFTATLFCGAADDRSAQDTLDAYVSHDGAPSVFAAINSNPTLGDVVDYAQVDNVEADQLIEYAGVMYLGAEVVIGVGAD